MRKARGTVGGTRFLLACGIASPLLSLVVDRLAGEMAEGYSFRAQSMSELSAQFAPTRPLAAGGSVVAALLLIAFGAGVWRSAGRGWRLRAVAALLTGNGLVVIVASALFPLHLGEDAGSPANRSNTMVMALGVFLLLLAMGLSAASRRSWFRLISAGILAAFAVLTVAGLVVSRVVPESERVSTVGVQERTMVAGFLAWEALLALDLLRAREGDLG